jgi:hypothetical protein
LRIGEEQRKIFSEQLCSYVYLKLIYRFKTGTSFQVLTAVSMKMSFFWGIVPCNPVEIYQHFRSAYRSMVEAVRTSEMSVSLYQTARSSIPDDGHLPSTPSVLYVKTAFI